MDVFVFVVTYTAQAARVRPVAVFSTQRLAEGFIESQPRGERMCYQWQRFKLDA